MRHVYQTLRATPEMHTRVHIVYDLGTQNLNFVAPIPEQIETITLHFSEFSGDVIIPYPMAYVYGTENIRYGAHCGLTSKVIPNSVDF